MKFWSQYFKTSFIDIKYEDLISSPDTKIKEGDYVTIFSIPSKIHEVEQLFRVSASYY